MSSKSLTTQQSTQQSNHRATVRNRCHHENDSGCRSQTPVFFNRLTELDIALGVGGYPEGRVIEIYGPEASGKTTLTLHAIAERQKRWCLCIH